MNIIKFKEGDIITRNEGVKYAHDGSIDGSYLGERLELVGVDETSKIIFLKGDMSWLKEGFNLSYGRDAWDEGWCYYPETMWQKIKNNLTK